MNNAAAVAPQRSAFVNVAAWIFICLSGMATLLSLLQNLMITSFFPMDEMRQSLHNAKGAEHFPALAMFMFAHFRAFVALSLVYSSIMLASAIGLLLRRNRARQLFIALRVLDIGWVVGFGIFFQLSFHSTLHMASHMPHRGPMGADTAFETMFAVVLVMSTLFSLAICALLAWVIMRLHSAPVRAEFK